MSTFTVSSARLRAAMQRNGVAVAAATVTLAALISSAQAAEPASAATEEEELTEVVITGTAIRGAAPVGVNLITVGREEIEESGGQTLQQILKSVPAVTGFGNSGQGGFQSFDGAGTFAPTIHGLGASASNGTLVLIDGHRLPLSGINHTLADPNVIAPLAIERVEVLPEGASSTYGSDAVAGVLNFITRRNFSGFEAAAQYASGDSYNSYSAGFIWGDVFDRGSLLMSYNYASQSNLTRSDRAYTLLNYVAQGGGNYLDANCGPATVQVGTSVYVYPYTGGAANPNPTAANSGICSYAGQSDLLPATQRHNVLVKLTRNITDNLEFSTDVVYSKLDSDNKVNRGSIQATAFGPGTASVAQINPFYTQPTGAVGTSQTVRWSADELFGPGAQQRAGAMAFFVTSSLAYKFGNNWLATLGATAGVDKSRQRSDGTLCTSCAYLALNGTTNTTGSTTTPSVVGNPNVIVLNSALTAANALDVWNPAATNRTSAAVRARLLDNTQLQIAHQSLKDFTLKVDGPVASLPGGDLRVAAGAEVAIYTMDEEQAAPLGTGPASTGTRFRTFDFHRDVTSLFAEVLIPIVGPGNELPLVKKLELDISGRRDEYNDFGATTNPKFAFSWGVTDGFTVRGNVGRSFTAPALTSRGDANGATAESGYSGVTGAGPGIPANFQIPITYPGASGLPAGACNTTTGLCTIANATITGIGITGGNKDLQPQKGETFSIGFDWASQAVQGLRVSGTYWSAKYKGAVTAPQAAFALASPSLGPQALIIYPTGATPAQIAALTSGLPQNGALPATVYFSYSFQQRNAFDLDASGIDLDIGYSFKTGLGDFDIGLNAAKKLKLDQKFGSDGQAFDVLNTIGINTTFPSNDLAAQARVGLKHGPVSGTLFFNYTGSYVNWGGTAGQGNAAWNVIRQNGLYPIGGGQPLGSNLTIDLHAAYDFQGEGFAKGLQVALDVDNLTDKQPPFVNTALGYDNFNANPIGRLITVGVTKKW